MQMRWLHTMLLLTSPNSNTASPLVLVLSHVEPIPEIVHFVVAADAECLSDGCVSLASLQSFPEQQNVRGHLGRGVLVSDCSQWHRWVGEDFLDVRHGLVVKHVLLRPVMSCALEWRVAGEEPAGDVAAEVA